MRALCAILIILVLISCTPSLIAEPESTPIQVTPSPSEEIRPIFTPTQSEYPDMSPTLQNLIEQAKADLAQRLSISSTDIIVLDAKVVAWSNSSLGCPQPGMAYADVITPGYLIVLQFNHQVYEYHAGKNLEVFLCDDPSPPIEGMPDNT